MKRRRTNIFPFLHEKMMRYPLSKVNAYGHKQDSQHRIRSLKNQKLQCL